MTALKLIVWITSLTGGAVGLFAPIGAVKWLMQTEPQDAGILTLFFFPVWCCLVVVGLLIGRRVGRSAIGTRRIAPRQHPPARDARCPSGKSALRLRASHPMRGALRTSRTRGGMRWT